MSRDRPTVAESFDNHWIHNQTNGCHEWQRPLAVRGYGQLSVNGHPRAAHRFAWERANGPVPKGLHVLHHCDNRRCVNVAHLFIGTNLDNTKDMHAKGRQRGGGPSGERHHGAKLNLVQVDEIRDRYLTGLFSQRQLARMYGVCQPSIGRIVRGEGWGEKSRTPIALKPVKVRRLSVADTFSDHWRINPETGCWLWSLSLNEDGYGHVKVKGRHISAHRFSYQMTHGDIPTGMVVRHMCDQPCVNPEHLCLGAQADNIRDMVIRRRNSTARGERNGMSKLTSEKVRMIRLRSQGGESRTSLGFEFGVTPSLISAIVIGRVWRHEVAL